MQEQELEQKKVVCPECVAEGKVSKVYLLGASSLFTPHYDETGTFVSPPTNQITRYYCSRHHVFTGKDLLVREGEESI
jgi:hypothetical protein